jgi:SNF2 family DNA or RNA helicase
MINFRKIKQDFASNMLSEGRDLYNDGAVRSAKIIELSSQKIRVAAQVEGSYGNAYECEFEIDSVESELIDSTCDCSYSFDCQHLAAALLYLEKNLEKMMVNFSKGEEFALDEHDEDERQHLARVIDKAKAAQEEIDSRKLDQQLIKEYNHAANILTNSPFFAPREKWIEQEAQLGLVLCDPLIAKNKKPLVDLQIVLRLSFRSKPLFVTDVRSFLDALKHEEPQELGGKRLLLTLSAFDAVSRKIATVLLGTARFAQSEDKSQRVFQMKCEDFGELLAKIFDHAMHERKGFSQNGSTEILPQIYQENLESPLSFFAGGAHLQFNLEYIGPPTTTLLLNPVIEAAQRTFLTTEIFLFDCSRPGFVCEGTFYRFQPAIKRIHLRHLEDIQSMAVPSPLFGTFVENALPELTRYASISGEKALEQFFTLPCAENLTGTCKISYLDGEMEAELWFQYGDLRVPAAPSQLKKGHVQAFEREEGISARQLHEEKQIIDALFQGFIYEASSGKFVAKTEKKIVEFMTENLPAFKDKIEFDCPQNLLDQFIYDKTQFKIHLRESANGEVSLFEVDVEVDGNLAGLNMDTLWDCVAAKKTFIETQTKKKKKGSRLAGRSGKILVLDLKKLAQVIQIFDEIGIGALENHTAQRPLWNLTHLTHERFENIPVEFSISEGLLQIQKQMTGEAPFNSSPIPKSVKATLRSYQVEGVAWLERLRSMHLGGVLADDMGLGKTLQAICALTAVHEEKPGAQSLIVCPTSLLYNWKEELGKFNPKLRVQVIDGIPARRHEMIQGGDDVDIFVTSYTLLQKDIEVYQKRLFTYLILDEAQHIKNRGTRNAKSVKMLKGNYRLILTGTPIENSLDELWSLFDFLMPGLLGSYERFVEKYLRKSENNSSNLENLKKKIFPFILRRMKQDVLKDLPPVSEITYHCQLTDVQQELYTSYALAAKEELSRLVQKEGFDKIRIHVLATLTRLKQICCHPAIFAKDGASRGDSAKYEMLMDLLSNLMENKKKAVIFSQYTKMLQIMRSDLEEMGVSFAYLDGATKNRMEIVKEFNENPDITVFLISLKAGGVGLNLTGADTVIHYDMWWNPAVEAQATDRVHRIGQKNSVSSYKMITLGTIEEKILSMQERKKGLVKQLINSDEEIISKLTWDEVLELLRT